MNLKQKWAAVVATVLLTAGLLASAAFAAGSATGQEPVDRAAQVEKVTASEEQVLRQIKELRHTYHQKFEAESQTIITQAVREGKITQAQADKLKRWQGRHDHGKHGHANPMTEAELKAKLNEAVQSGRLTPEQAKRILEHHAKTPK